LIGSVQLDLFLGHLREFGDEEEDAQDESETASWRKQEEVEGKRELQ